MTLVAVGDPQVDAELARRLVPRPVEPPAPIRAPEMSWRPARADELGRAAASMLALAERHGWTVRAWLARGPYLDARGRDSGTADGVTLIFRKSARPTVGHARWYRRADAEWKFAHARTGRDKMTSAELRAWLQMEVADGDAQLHD